MNLENAKKFLLKNGFKKEEIKEIEVFIKLLLEINEKEQKSLIRISKLILKTGLSLDDIYYLATKEQKDCLNRQP